MARMTRRPVAAAPAEDYDESGSVDMDKEPVEAAPAPRVARRSPAGGPIQSGWGAPAQNRRETVKAPYLTVDTKKKIVKILDDAPAVRYQQHWVVSVKKFFTCIASEDTNCPLCAVGHNPSRKFMMNVVDMENPDVVTTWSFGPQVAQLLQEHEENKPAFPLTGEKTYFFVWRVKGANDRWENRIEFIRSRDLEEEQGIIPLTEAELDTLGENLYGEETIFIPSDKMLREAAENYSAYNSRNRD